MKIKEIQIDGFGVWTGLSVDALSDGMTLFYGPNEAGKTTLMQFIRSMFYGYSKERQNRYFPPVFGGKPGGAILASGAGGDYRICRNPCSEPGRSGDLLTITNEEGNPERQHRLTSLLGQVDEAIFSNVFAIGIRELQELSSLDGTQAADELYKLSSGLDRVSLVEVMHGLRQSRDAFLGQTDTSPSENSEQLQQLLKTHQRLKEDVRTLTQAGQRWVELSTQLRTQSKEIEGLSAHVKSLEREARCVEMASSIFELWHQRSDLENRIEERLREPQLPVDASKHLAEIENRLEQSFVDLETIKEKRRDIRRQAAKIPINSQQLKMQGSIKAASEQIPWIETLDDQLQLLEEQLQKTKNQVDLDVQGFEAVGLQAENFSSSKPSGFPQLSRSSISTLAGPAKEVKQSLFVLRQARSQAKLHQEEADRIGEKLEKILQRANAEDLQSAIQHNTEELRLLRDRVRVSEHLENLKRHYRELEQDAIELATAEALPVDRLILLAVPFIFGALSLVYGVANLMGLTFLVNTPDSNWGTLCMVMGAIGLALFYFGRESGQRHGSINREEGERQISSVRKQILQLESDRNQIDSQVTLSDSSFEYRVREKEALLDELELSLPTYHQHEAAKRAFDLSKRRAKSAEKQLDRARSQWSDSLAGIGLSRSMSPTKVRSLRQDYDRLELSLQKWRELEAEYEIRKGEKRAIAIRVEQLYQDWLGCTQDEAEEAEFVSGEAGFSSGPITKRSGPLEQLTYLNEELSRQAHWLKHRRELKQQDLELKLQQSACSRKISDDENKRAALWVKCGVTTAEEFYRLVDSHADLVDSKKQLEETDHTLTQLIGNQFEQVELSQQIDGASLQDLESSWDSLTTTISEHDQRISELQIHQGEMTQEKKHLAGDDRLATARFELACVQRKLESKIQRWQILAMTGHLLEDVCSTVEKDRQPETLREASDYLTQLTNGKYQRIWTSLGQNQLHVDDSEGEAITLDRLSRGTREAVFVALRLSLSAVYARRGMILPMILDDVLVNFDRDRARFAAKTLLQFARQGHQVMMFTCHQHVVDIFQEIGVEVRVMPPHGLPGRAIVLSESQSSEIGDAQSEDTPWETEEVVEHELAIESDEQSETIENEDHEVGQEDQGLVVDPKTLAVAEVMETPTVQEPDFELMDEDRDGKSSLEPTTQSQKPVMNQGVDWAWFEKEPAEMVNEVRSVIQQSLLEQSDLDRGSDHYSVVASEKDEASHQGFAAEVAHEDSEAEHAECEEAEYEKAELEEAEYEDEEYEDEEYEDEEYEDEEYEDEEYEEDSIEPTAESERDNDSDDPLDSGKQEVA
ncbi:MAG: AAA family ATPase [Planctomycetota bacterium]|nr:AAA family ATPase [Planctomycetota bacterium]